MNKSRFEDMADSSGQEISNSKSRPKAGAGSFRRMPKPVTVSDPEVEIIYRDRFFCVVNKPAGVPTQTQGRDKDILTLVAQTIKKPEASLHLVNRLDQPVAGLLIIAFSSDVHAAFERLRLNDSIKKTYLAVTTDIPATSSGALHDYLVRDGRHNSSAVVSAETIGSKSAKLSWIKLAQSEDNNGQRLALLAIRLDTGRHHQIRVQLANAGWPIYGDRKYGSKQAGIQENIALVSYGLDFVHPISSAEISLNLKLPAIHPFTIFCNLTDLSSIDFEHQS